MFMLIWFKMCKLCFFVKINNVYKWEMSLELGSWNKSNWNFIECFWNIFEIWIILLIKVIRDIEFLDGFLIEWFVFLRGIDR